jgi:hypothetical protein
VLLIAPAPILELTARAETDGPLVAIIAIDRELHSGFREGGVLSSLWWRSFLSK